MKKINSISTKPRQEISALKYPTKASPKRRLLLGNRITRLVPVFEFNSTLDYEMSNHSVDIG